jgi:hypothetical protein
VGRYIVRFTGKGAPPPDAFARFAAAPGVDVVERAGRMVLVDSAGGEAPLRRAASEAGPAADDWLIAPEITYELPDPRKKPKPPSRPPPSEDC